uniref:phenylalanine--tRNA ligase n=1 Tax=Taenioma perpusillum TaxID=210852 RepID=A0A1Z1MS56_9FLOR|nr:Phenylalanine-tRNA ligase beta subunit [Taenioma perpusillum]ARW68595.1 Phenylalanine-tRNA ligase beta subunit [Taenioma perpusillum]
MRFSWNILNSFINLDAINLTDFIEQLNLAGLEVEKIEEKNNLLTKSIDLDITTNRKEIFCIVNLGIEISSIFNIPLKIKFRPFKIQNLYKNNIQSYKLYKDDKIIYIKIHNVYIGKEKKTPEWMKQILKLYDIENECLLYNIQQYIEIKWGHKFYFFTDNLEKKELENLSRYQHDQIIYNIFYKKLEYNNCTIDKHNNKITIYWPIIDYIKNTRNTFVNAYEEAIRLITTYQKSIIGKSSEYYNINYINDNNISQKIFSKDIKYLLGKTKNRVFLSTNKITKILNQLNLKPQYSFKYKQFVLEIPTYRKHDLKRNIDIIEEVGRIYGFKNFLSQLPIYKKLGSISLKYFYIQKIRNTLRIMGIREIITPSLNNTKNLSPYTIELYNPLTEDQNKLRENIIYNLISNYKLNIKLQNINNSFFEIGQVFYKTPKLIQEETHLGILIQSNNFLKGDWSGKEDNLSWSNAKGIIENLFTILDSQITWNKNTYSDKRLNSISNYFHPSNYILLFDKLQKNLVGIFGEINYKLFNIKNTKKTYLLEIGIIKLIKTIKNKKHLNYTTKQYSFYPGVSRDISIKISKDIKIKDIKQIILRKYIELIESVYILSDYYSTTDNERSICLRLKYKSIYRTLNQKDLNNINKNIMEIIQTINQYI